MASSNTSTNKTTTATAGSLAAVATASTSDSTLEGSTTSPASVPNGQNGGQRASSPIQTLSSPPSTRTTTLSPRTTTWVSPLRASGSTGNVTNTSGNPSKDSSLAAESAKRNSEEDAVPSSTFGLGRQRLTFTIPSSQLHSSASSPPSSSSSSSSSGSNAPWSTGVPSTTSPRLSQVQSARTSGGLPSSQATPSSSAPTLPTPTPPMMVQTPKRPEGVPVGLTGLSNNKPHEPSFSASPPGDADGFASRPSPESTSPPSGSSFIALSSSPEQTGNESAVVLDGESDCFNLIRYLEPQEDQEMEIESEPGVIFAVLGTEIIIKAGQLELLLDKIVDHTFRDAEYSNEFLLTYHYFTTPLDLLEGLIERFYRQPAVDPLWRKFAMDSNRAKICEFLRRWIQLRYKDDFEEDEKVLKSAVEFIQRIASTAEFERIGGALMKHLKSNQKPPSRKKQHLPRGLAPPPKAGESASASTPGGPSKNATLNKRRPSVDPLEVVDFTPRDIAVYLTKIEAELLRAIRLREYSKQAWTKANKQTEAPNIMAFTEHFNRVSMWVSTEILSTRNWRKRADRLEHFIKVAEELLNLRNFNGAHEIMAGVGQTTVKRLKSTWEAISERAKKIYARMERLLSTERNFKLERETLENDDPPCIPFLGIYLSDLVFLEEGNPSMYKGFINFSKWRKVAKVFKVIQKYQTSDYGSLMNPPHFKMYFQTITPLDEAKQYELSYHILPRGSTRSEKELEKEEAEREAEVEVIVYLEDESGEKRQVVLRHDSWVKQAKEKICALKWTTNNSGVHNGSAVHNPAGNTVQQQKLRPQEYSLFLAYKDKDFKKHGGFLLDDDRTIGSYRLKKDDPLVLCKRSGTPDVSSIPQRNLADTDEVVVSVESKYHGCKRVIKAKATTTVNEVKRLFISRAAGGQLANVPGGNDADSFEVYYQEANNKFVLMEGDAPLNSFIPGSKIATLAVVPVATHFLYQTEAVINGDRPTLFPGNNPTSNSSSIGTTSGQVSSSFDRSSIALGSLGDPTVKRTETNSFKAQKKTGSSPALMTMKGGRSLSLKSKPKEEIPWLHQLCSNSPALVVLDLRDTPLPKRVWKPMAWALSTNTHLLHLDLVRVGMGDYGAKYLARGLRGNQTLVYLNISDNNLSLQSLVEIKKAVMENFSLTKVDINESKPSLEFQIGIAAIKKSVDTLTATNRMLTQADDNDVSFSCIDRALSVIPDKILDLSHLLSLDFSKNALASIPSEISKLSLLETLVLDDNVIETIPQEILSLKQLKRFSLNRNRIRTLPSYIGLLELLEELYLEGNQLTVLPRIIGTLHKLRSLRVNDNRLTPTDYLPETTILEGNQAILRALQHILSTELTSVNRMNVMILGDSPAKLALLSKLRGEASVDEELSPIQPLTTGSGRAISIFPLVTVEYLFQCWDIPSLEDWGSFVSVSVPNGLVMLVIPATSPLQAKMWLNLVPRNRSVMIVGVKIKEDDANEWDEEMEALSKEFKEKIQQHFTISLDSEDDLWLLKQFMLKNCFFVDGDLKGVDIPYNYLALEAKVLAYKKCFVGRRTIGWADFYTMAVECCKIPPESLQDAMLFLHKTGCIFYEQNFIDDDEPLFKDRVFLDVKYASRCSLRRATNFSR